MFELVMLQTTAYYQCYLIELTIENYEAWEGFLKFYMTKLLLKFTQEEPLNLADVFNAAIPQRLIS